MGWKISSGLRAYVRMRGTEEEGSKKDRRRDKGEERVEKEKEKRRRKRRVNRT